ncbi:MAG: PSD1 and planctomycete cytochrome C domain-containing protein [Chthoniobacter sp.]|nr:PSD1 and planctomycete cytochrome C domain-containing protein [Chthoniobacter sp.]
MTTRFDPVILPATPAGPARRLGCVSLAWFGPLLCGMLLSGIEAAADEAIFREDFDGFRDGRQNAAQVDSGLRLSFGGSLPGWRRTGQGAVHVVDRSGAGDLAAMIWEDNILTREDGLAANERGRNYLVEYDLGPTVYATPPQASAATDGLVIEVLRADGSVLAAHQDRPGAWAGRQEFHRSGFDYRGDGSGPVRLQIRTLTRAGRFGGAVDNLIVAAHSPAAEHFNAQVAPVLARNCLECHHGSGAKGKLDLSTRDGAGRGGKSGPVLVPGDVAGSELYAQIEADEMPPKHPLPAADRRIIRDWIKAGATWGQRTLDPFVYSTGKRAGYDWWALQPLRAVPPPDPEISSAAANEIDRFLVAKLQASGLRPSPRAEPRVLVRRLFIDLTGLPPSPEEVEAFSRDPSPQAWARLVDRLLASTHYGERWARHWLDVVRFGESDGYEYNGPREAAWPYRDWVIRALNADLPYDEFVRLQLAGDALRPGTFDGAAATGFLVAGVQNKVAGAAKGMKETQRQDELEDLAGMIGQSLLGLTINCARCHDHKFDPIGTEDYYRFTALLAGVRDGTRKMPGDDGTTVAVYTVMAEKPVPTHVLLRGDVASPGVEVAPGGLRAVVGVKADFGLGSEAGDAARRTKLAAWVTDPGNGLFLRVIVNRIWHHHFGRGLVETPGDFGFNGDRPSHPELLDWLAGWFRDHGQSLKQLHRLILTSAAYQQTSAPTDDGTRLDAANRLLWRQNPRRVEAEVLRDSILLVAGQLNPTPFGPGYRDVKIVEVSPAFYYLPTDPAGPEFNRRTVYRWCPRGQRSALLDTFDCPDPSVQTPRRSVTTTPSQALSQWNNAFVLRMAESMAARIAAEQPAAKGSDPDPLPAQVERAWRLVLGRAPGGAERSESDALVRRHGLALLCRVLFNSNEFIVIE